MKPATLGLVVAYGLVGAPARHSAHRAKEEHMGTLVATGCENDTTAAAVAEELYLQPAWGLPR